MTAPSPDLREALEAAERYRRLRSHNCAREGEYEAVPLADEIYRLRAELADETKQRLVLAATLQSDWATLCNAMTPVVRAADRFEREPMLRWAEFVCAVRDFRASGFLPDIELEDSDAAGQ